MKPKEALERVKNVVYFHRHGEEPEVLFKHTEAYAVLEVLVNKVEINNALLDELEDTLDSICKFCVLDGFTGSKVSTALYIISKMKKG